MLEAKSQMNISEKLNSENLGNGVMTHVKQDLTFSNS